MTISELPESRTRPPAPELRLVALPGSGTRGRAERSPDIDAASRVRAALESGDLSAASDLLTVAWFSVLRDDRFGIRGLLEELSATQLTAHPLLAMALGIMYNGDGMRRSKAGYYFGLASLGLRSGSGPIAPVQRALILAGESAALRLIGRTGLAVRSARAGVEALEQVHADRAAYIGHLPRLYAQLGTTLYYGGHEAEALEIFARGYAEAGETDRSSFGNIAMISGIHAFAGNLHEAFDHVVIARGEPWTDEQRAKYPGTFYRLAEAVLALERFDVTEARWHLDAMQHDRRSIEHWVAIARVEAMTALLEQDAARGLAELEAFAVLRASEANTPSNRRRLASVRVLLHLALGNYEAAATVLQRDGGDTPQAHVDRARLALVDCRTSEALREVRTIAGRLQSSRTAAEALSIEAAIALRTGGAGRRTKLVLQQLLSVLRRTRQRLALNLVPEADFDALCTALDEIGGSDVLEGREHGSLLLSPERPQLTDRELAVLRALGRTGSLKEIAAELFVSTNTVKSQLRSLYRKLDVRGREEALTVAMQRHLISWVGDDAARVREQR